MKIEIVDERFDPWQSLVDYKKNDLQNNPKIGASSNHNIANMVIDTNESFDYILSDIVDKNNIDLLILAGFMKILPKKMTDKYDGVIINIHPSILPKYGGKGMYGSRIHDKVIDS